MRELGVDVARISPQAQHTDRIIGLFHDVITKKSSAADAMREMGPLMPEQPCNGYWYGKPGLDQMVA
jgi:O2-independent ubiquinone biosynthesis protein UbiV